MEFRILNAYRDGDMKAHRREAKNTALIECVQVAAEKAKWPLREEFKRMSSREGGGGIRAAIPLTPREPTPQRTAASQQRTSYDRTPAVSTHEPPAPPPASPPPPRSPAPSHGATRFSSVFGNRRR
jgi:CO/xanthine dehydrogenase Mo-binding subunit